MFCNRIFKYFEEKNYKNYSKGLYSFLVADTTLACGGSLRLINNVTFPVIAMVNEKELIIRFDKKKYYSKNKNWVRKYFDNPDKFECLTKEETIILGAPFE